MANPDPTGTKEYKEQRARYEKRKAAGHWTGKTKAQREKEKKERKKKEREKKEQKSVVSKGIGAAARQSREIDKYVQMLKE